MELSDLMRIYDFRSLDRKCNFRRCSRSPGRKIVIYEHDNRTGMVRDLISFCFCSRHADTAESLISDKIVRIKNINSYGKVLKIRSQEIGILTH